MIPMLDVGLVRRVSALAPTNGVLVSSTVKELVAGSDLAFDDFGVHELKGVPHTWHLFKVGWLPVRGNGLKSAEIPAPWRCCRSV